MRFLFVLPFAALLAAQNPEPVAAQGCAIAGYVVNSVTGAPLRKAEVRLILDTSAPSASGVPVHPEEPGETVSAADGAFSFTALKPGTYRLWSDRNGYEARYWGAKDHASQGQTLRLEAGEKRDGIKIELIPLSVITGKVVDGEGDPVPYVRVEALVPVYTEGGRNLQTTGSALTNDLGEYRLHSLEARKYYLRADPARTAVNSPYGRFAREALADSYYPGAADASGAAQVQLVPGQQLNGIDFVLHMGRRVVVSGRVAAPPNASQIQIVYGQSVPGGFATTTFEPSDPAGHFTIRGLATGNYILSAHCTVAGQEYSTNVPLTVGSTDVENIELTPAPPVAVAGRVSFDGPPSDKLASAHVVLNAKLAHSQSLAEVQSDGTFSIHALTPDVYRLGFQTQAEAFVKEARWGNVNVLESGLDLSTGASASDVRLVISTAVGMLDGTVLNDKQEPLPGATVALRAEAAAGADDPPAFKSAKAAPDGKFHIGGIAPRRYRLLAMG